MTKLVSKARIEQLMSLIRYEFVVNETSRRTLTSEGIPTSRQNLARREPPRHLRRQQIILTTGHFLRVQEMLFSVREKLK